MIYGSVCSGIEAASVAWGSLGWKASFLSEIEAFPRAVLHHHYPHIPLHGDFTTIQAAQYEPIDLLVGGTPCQSFSVAGLRGGLADERGNLALEYLRLAERLRPRWLVWENVPGVRSSGSGRDFGAFLGGLGELGYGWAYRSLDAQYFGLAQRRERVFVVGYLGDWRRAAAVLFEPKSLRGHPAPSREARAGTAIGTLGGTSPGGGWRFGPDEAAAGQLIPFDTTNLTSAGNYSHPRPGDPCHPLTVGSHPPAVTIAPTLESGSNRTGGTRPPGTTVDTADSLIVTAYRTSGNCGAWEIGDRTDALTTGSDRTSSVIAFQTSQSGTRSGDVHATLDSHNGSRRHNGALIGSAVRRLTPRECERLQGFPDDYTAIPYRGKVASDGPRYKALGNSMAVPCMAWIGRRIGAAA